MTLLDYTFQIPTPPPLAAGAGFQTYTDPNGDLWVAAGGVLGGVWKRAKDALVLRTYRSAAFAMTNGAAVPMDSVQGTVFGLIDPYGMFQSGGITLPVSGTWMFSFQISTTATAAGQYINATLMSGPTVINYSAVCFANASGNIIGSGAADIWPQRVAGQNYSLTVTISAALNCYNNYSRTWLTAQYIGTN
jgi:hypothetical protein